MENVSQPFSAEQLKLLIHFEAAESLLELAQLLHKDQSVVSRNLQSLADVAPVIEKVNRRWMLTDLGRKVISESRQFNSKINQMLASRNKTENHLLKPNSLLLLINPQMAMIAARSGGRALENMKKLLHNWRAENRPVIFVRHGSQKSESVFNSANSSFEFIPGLEPRSIEPSFIKFRSSVLSSNEVLNLLNEKNFANLFLIGFTGSDCIEASARDLTESAFSTYVVSDASSSLDILGPDGKLHLAERVHSLSMANINAYSAKVILTADLINPQK